MQTLDNVTTVTSDTGQQTASASVGVTTPNPTNIPTGLTNYFFLDSFFLPLVIAIVGVWLYRQGFIGTPKWLTTIQMGNKENRAQKQLHKKISQIQQKEVK